MLVAEPGGPAATLAAVKKLVEELAGPEEAAKVEGIPVPAADEAETEPEAETELEAEVEAEVPAAAEEEVKAPVVEEKAAPAPVTVPVVKEPAAEEKKDVEMTDAPVANGEVKASSVAPEEVKEAAEEKKAE